VIRHMTKHSNIPAPVLEPLVMPRIHGERDIRAIVPTVLPAGTPVATNHPRLVVTVPNATGELRFSLVARDKRGRKSPPAVVTVKIDPNPVAIFTEPQPVPPGDLLPSFARGHEEDAFREEQLP